MSRKSVGRVALVLTLLIALVIPGAAFASPVIDHLRFMAPASPGGGWDTTTRLSARVLQEQGIVGSTEVFNVPGAGGTIGLSRLAAAERGRGDLLMTTGLVMVGAILTNNAPVTLEEVTPIARLTSAFEVIVVPADSPYQTLNDLIEAFKADPGSISWGGGSAGGVDHILVGLIAKEVGVDPSQINYIPFSGGGEALASILGGHVSAGVSGYGEWQAQIESGQLRALAVSSGERLEGIDVPTLIEQGIDVEIANWRGFVAAPGIAEEERQALVEALDRMVETDQWQEILKRQNWNDYYLSGDPFVEFIKDESTRVREILADLGLLN